MKVFDWNVDLKVGAKQAKVNGTLWWIPTGQVDRADALIAAAVAKEAQAKPPEAHARSVGGDDDAGRDRDVARRRGRAGRGDRVGLLVVLVHCRLARARCRRAAPRRGRRVRARRRGGGDPSAPKGEVW